VIASVSPAALLPASIPSPSEEWAGIPYGRWLNDAGLTFVPEGATIRLYAVCILVGILAAVVILRARLKSRGADPGAAYDVALFAVVLGIAVARAYHVLTHPDDYFGPGANTWNIFQPGSVWAFWEGGIAIFGALIGGAVGVYLAARLNGLRFWSVADALAPGLLLAQAFGRFGNWFNQELFGAPTDAWWGLEIDRPNPAIPLGLPDDTLFQPTFLFEVTWNVVGVIALLAAEKHFRRVRRDIGGASVPALEGVSYRLQWGRLTGLYLVWYGTGRIVFESIRLDPSEVLLGVRVNVWGAFAAVVLGFLIIIVQGRRHPGREPSPYLPGREWSPDAAVDSLDTYADTPDDAEPDAADVREPAAVASSPGSTTASTRASNPATSGATGPGGSA